MTPAARRLLALLLLDVRSLMRALEAGRTTVQEWQQAFGAALAKYHTAALLIGQGNTTVTPQARRYLQSTVRAQLKFLGGFALDIQEAAQFKPGWLARSALYAQGIGASFWKGKTRMLPLPAMPRDGTTNCKTNCGCAWEISELDGEGNYDCYWRRGKTDSCQTCVQREREWSPLKIRDNQLV